MTEKHKADKHFELFEKDNKKKKHKIRERKK